MDQLLELIIETATRMMDAKASSLLLVDPKKNKLYFKVATGEKKKGERKPSAANAALPANPLSPEKRVEQQSPIMHDNAVIVRRTLLEQAPRRSSV